MLFRSRFGFDPFPLPPAPIPHRGATVAHPVRQHRVIAAPLQLSFVKLLYGHLKLKAQFGLRVVKLNKWRFARDFVLLSTCLFNVLKVLSVRFGWGLGMTDGYDDLSFLISIFAMLFLSGMFLADLLAKRYFMGWHGE